MKKKIHKRSTALERDVRYDWKDQITWLTWGADPGFLEKGFICFGVEVRFAGFI